MAIMQSGLAPARDVAGSARDVATAARQPRAAGARVPGTRLPPSRVLRRSCACDGKQAQDKCGDCAESPSGSSGLHRSALRRSAGGADRLAGSKAPPIVGQALSSAGSPLQPLLRTELEGQLGADFSAVRVHTDATAAASAVAVDAQAYTLGSDIVFGAGRFEPGSQAGRRLLTHELAHVVQQPVADRSGPAEIGAADSEVERQADRVSAGTGSVSGPGTLASPPAARRSPVSSWSPVIRRAEAPETVQATPPAPAPAMVPAQAQAAPPRAQPAPSCGADQMRSVSPALTAALRWLRAADQGLTAFTSNAAAPAGASAGRALSDHFRSNDAATARYVLNTIRQIESMVQAMSTGLARPGGQVTVGGAAVQCHSAQQDSVCAVAGAYVQGQLMVICPTFFNGDQNWRSSAMVHELAHSLTTTGDHMDITDRAYRADRKYRDLTTAEALTNAESYQMLVRQLGLGTPVASTAPADAAHDCPPAWRRALELAAGDAQRWNRDALVTVTDRRPGIISAYQAHYDRFLGGHTAAHLDAAARDFGAAEAAFRESIDFECEPGATGGRCSHAETYWYAIWSHLHVCPVWLTHAAPDQAEGILAGMFGYKADVDGSRRRALAQLARAIHMQDWALPAAATVTAALAGPGPVAPAPPAAPPPAAQPPTH